MIVVSGAGGRLGGMVADNLAALGLADKVVLTTRDPERLAARAAQGFTLRRADFAQPEGLGAAFAEADALLLISATGPTERRIALHRAAFDAARDAQVGRIVYTSRVNPVTDSLYPYAPIHVFSEAYLQQLGIPWTIARNNEYAENLAPAVEPVLAGEPIMVPGNRGAIPWIAASDIAEILAKLLAEDGHQGRIYELNGARSFTRIEIAALVADISGREVDISASREDYVEYIRSRGMPDYVVAMVDGMYQATDAGEFATVHPDAETLLGRPPMPLEKFLPPLLQQAGTRRPSM